MLTRQPMSVILQFDRFTFDPATRTLLRDGTPVQVGGRAFDLLHALVLAGGELVTKERLLELVWPGLVVEEANVQVQVSALRKLLGPAAIATVAGRGYRFTLPISEGKRPIPHNLPAERSAFVGREDELAKLDALLGGARLLTLGGIGGTGKTRLACKLAERGLDRFPDGVWWADLTPIDREEQLAPLLAQLAGCKLDGSSDAFQMLTNRLRHRRVLFLLDNCEHLLDASAALVDRLLKADAGVRIIATTREALGVDCEVFVQVKPLQVPEVGASAARVRQSDAVRLFEQAARIARGDFAITDENVHTIAKICRRLDGIPLALELAAVRLRVLAPGQLLEAIEEQLQLTFGNRRARPRQQTLESVIRWSFELLRGEERELLMALSVCAGGCDLSAARALVSSAMTPTSLIQGVSRLVDLSLLEVQYTLGVARYRFLETVRQFASQALASEWHENPVRERHCVYYTGLAEALSGSLSGADRLAALEALDVERDNIGRALDWAISRGELRASAKLVQVMGPYWWARGLLAHGLERGLPAVAAAGVPAAADASTIAGLCIHLAELALPLGRLAEARSLAETARFHACECGSAIEEIKARVVIAGCDLREGNAERARRDLEAMLPLVDTDGPEAHLLLEVANMLGEAYVTLGDWSAARKSFAAALEFEQRKGDVTGTCTQLLNLAFVAVRVEEVGEVLRLIGLIAECLRIARHHFHDCAMLDIAACAAGIKRDWPRCLRWHVAATRHFADAGYMESAQRRERRLTNVQRAGQALTADRRQDIERDAADSTLQDDLNDVLDWIARVEARAE